MTSPVQNTRKPDHPVARIFVDRWSPRSFTGEAIPTEELMTILEAGRWAPSSYNSQPWRFVWARRETPAFDAFMELLTGRNPEWCAKAAALVVLVSSETMMVPGSSEPKPSYSHSLDAGSAWMSIALQAEMLGWAAHGMVGFDIPRAAELLKVPTGFRVEMALAIGRRGEPAALAAPFDAMEQPNARRPLAETAFEGAFPV